MNYHEVTTKIIDLLQSHKVWFETFEHEPVRTSEEAAKIRDGYTLEQGAKSMIARIKITNADRKFIMLVLPGNLRFDNDKVKRIFNAKDIRLSTQEEVSLITGGIQPGGVPPFGMLFGLETLADPRLFENEKIVFNAGDRRFSIGMKLNDYKSIVNPRIVSIVQIKDS